MNSFDRAWSKAAARLEATFGTHVMIRPQAPSQYRGPVPDPDRAPFPCEGVFAFKDADVALQGRRGELQSFITLHAADAALWLRASVAAAIPYALRADDRLVLPERAGEPVFGIGVIKPADTGDLLLALVAERNP